jgi:hypothetical protein
MNFDSEFERAINIGQANKRIIELARNWCAHLTVERCGGTGLVEVQTGLPIGMRQFKCPHANAAGMAGMDLEHIALDFYDRNCEGCRKRLPVNLPNLSEIVADRDKALQRAKEAEALEAEAEKHALDARATRRSYVRLRTDRRQAMVEGAVTWKTKVPVVANFTGQLSAGPLCVTARHSAKPVSL